MGGEKKFTPEQPREEGLTLNEAQRPFLEKKLVQYRGRLERSQRRTAYLAPEVIDSWEEHYDSAAKVLITEALLESNHVVLDDIVASMEKAYAPKTHPELAESHKDLIDEAVRNAWEVAKAYNEGRVDELVNAQSV